ncbi:MAG: tetratricopeptide repeat protein [Lachnospiraceae bacterium]|nr:tetratricopeptide repeat protein [Lachnospiraceae bacterium]
MNNLIEKIGLVYHNTDIFPSIFLLLFFRMMGIYVHEYQTNLSVNVKRCKDIYFAIICLISEKCTPDELTEYVAHFQTQSLSQKIIFMVPNRFHDKFFNHSLLAESANQYTIWYNDPDNRKEKINLLYHLITVLCPVDKFTSSVANTIIQWEEIKENLKVLAEIYVRHDLQNLSLKGKFFYSNKYLFKDLQKQYIQLITDIFHSVPDWTDDENLFYSRLAFINMGYEFNALCQKNDEPYIYSSRHLLILCNDLIDRYGNSVNLLMLKGQIYEDLLKQHSKAYECYIAANQKAKGFNVYTLYKLGMYKEKNLYFWSDAIEDYQNALELYPGYYRVLYRLGICEEKLEHTHRAISAYKRIYTILKDKIADRCLRPMEIEYLFKISLKLASLYEYNVGDVTRSYHYYRNAEKTYSLIKQSHFLEALMGQDTADELNSIIEEHLNIDYVLEKIYWYNRNQNAVKKLLQN